jgi:hypothetical protein
MRVFRAIAAFVLLLFVAVGVAACGGGEETIDLASATPREIAEAATLDGVHSGELEVSLEVDRHHQTEQAYMRTLGSFMRAGKEDLPQIDMAIESQGSLVGRKLDFSAGLSLLPDRAVVYYAPQTYQPDEATFEGLRTKFEDAQEAGDEGNAMACVEAAEGIQITDLAHGFALEGHREDTFGVPLTWLNADLDLPAAIDFLVQLAEDPACGAQLSALGVPPVAELEAAKAGIEGRVEVQLAVDKHGIVRYLYLDGKGKSTKPGMFRLGPDLEAELKFHLAKVNEIAELPLPSGSTPFEALLRQFGTDLDAVREADGSESVLAFLEALGGKLTGR